MEREVDYEPVAKSGVRGLVQVISLRAHILYKTQCHSILTMDLISQAVLDICLSR